MSRIGKLGTAAALLLSLAAPAAFAAGQNGAAAGVSHWLGVLNSGARSTGMAGALAADTGSLDSLGSNPAGLANLRLAQASFTHNLLILDSSSDHLALGYSPMDSAGLALGLDYVNFGSVDLYSIDANGLPRPEGQAQPSAYSANLNWGQALGLGLDLGLGAKWISQTLNGQAASTVAGDAGLRWGTPIQGLGIGLSLLNFGGQLFGANLPTETRLGAAYDLEHFDLALDVSWVPADQSGPIAVAGAEIKPFDFLAIRGGYRQGGADSASGPAVGLGLSFGWGRLDYAYNMVGAFARTQQFSLTALLPQARAARNDASTLAAAPDMPDDANPDSLTLRLVAALKSQDEDQKRMRALMEKIALQGLAEPSHQASQAVKEESLKPAVFKGDFESAARDAKAMIALEPNNADGYMALGFLDWHLHKFDESLLNLRQALSLDPTRDYLKPIIQRMEKAK